jgi:benzoyl-CoA reductase/2-hydroxyglutaryl-CoA dehydratase subunit BcrC/BadD/HgdB
MNTRVIYSCPFIPVEWIAAHGLEPVRVMPRADGGRGGAGPAFGVCTYVRAFIAEVVCDPRASAVVMTTLCDQMRRAAELVSRECDTPVFLMNVPSTWQTPGAHRLYRDELERLGRFLVGLGGRAPSGDELVGVMLEYDARRSALRAAGGHLPARRYAEAIAAFHARGELPGDLFPPAQRPGSHAASPQEGHRVPLALIGGPMVRQDLMLFDLVERSGGCIVLNGTETGERMLPAPLDRRQVRDDPLMEMTRAYFGTIPDVSRRPNSELYAWLGRNLRERGARGLVFRRHVWCDLWHAELHRVKEWANVPVLDLDDGDGAEAAPARLAGRIEAFLEMLR